MTCMQKQMKVHQESTHTRLILIEGRCSKTINEYRDSTEMRD